MLGEKKRMMMSSLLSKSLSRGFKALFRGRRLSAVAYSFQEDSLFLPTRHSRHAPPPACLDLAHLTALTQEVLEAGPGSLFTYDRSHDDDAWSVSEVDEVIQKVEYLVRGHAARIPLTISNKLYTVSAEDDPDPHLQDMKGLIDRITEEGYDYVKLRSEMNAQLVPAEEKKDDEADKFDFEVDIQDAEFVEESSKGRVPQLADDKGASPGMTVAMVDTYFDALSVAPGSCSPKDIADILDLVVRRYREDGSLESNTNVHTIPTVMTFNAVLRALSTNMDLKSDEAKRDAALQLGLGIYDSMRYMVDRNSATYTYVLKLIDQCLPPSRSRGNIAHGLWTEATRESVVDLNVIEAFRDVQSKSGNEFAAWVRDNVPADSKELPLQYRKNAKQLRYQAKDMTY
jgi:hypothetical protein